MTIRARLTRIETAVERSNPTNKKRLINRDEFEACVRRIDRSFEIRRLRKGVDYTDSDLRRCADKMLRGYHNFGGFAFDWNEFGMEGSKIGSSNGGLNDSTSRKHI